MSVGRQSIGRFSRTAITSALAACACLQVCAEVPVIPYDVVAAHPHDTSASTQGLLFLNGVLYESTGGYGTSTVRQTHIQTGSSLRLTPLSSSYFAEGIAYWNDKLFVLTYVSEQGFVFDLETLEIESSFDYEGSGWGLTQDGTYLIMSDGSADLRYLEPSSLKEVCRVRITYGGHPVGGLNELEWAEGLLYANVFPTDWIAAIDPAEARVVALLNVERLREEFPGETGNAGEANGIAYNQETRTFYVTGKGWPRIFEVRLETMPASEKPGNPCGPSGDA